MISPKVIGSFIKKEFKQIMRSREMLIVLFALPAVQLLVMGFAVTNEVKNLNLSFLDYDRSSISQALIQSFDSSDRFRIVPVDTAANPQELISAWKASVVIVLPPRFWRGLSAGPAEQFTGDS